MVKNGELSSVQKRMITALLTNRTLGAACEAVGVGRTTLSRWMADAKFNQALIEAEGAAMRDTARTMLAGKDTALDTLHELMTDAATDNVRRQAAVDWLTFLHRAYEMENLETRLTRLEEAAHDKH